MHAAGRYGGYINPDKFALAQLANMTFPGWIVLTLILLAVNLFIRKKLAWLSVAVLVACIGPILTISPLNFTSRSLSPDDESRTFTLLTYNVYNFRDNQGVNPEWGNRTYPTSCRPTPTSCAFRSRPTLTA